MLCYRCEHRAKFLENKGQPRYECGCVKQSVSACYMFEPVKPVVTKRATGDKRPRLAGWGISARESFKKVAECQLRMTWVGKKDILLYWLPEGCDEKSN